MSEEELGIVGSEMGFLWEDENQCWANNLSNESSPILSGGGTGEEEEEKAEEGKKAKHSGDGAKANKLGKDEAGNNNKKRGRGVVCKINNNGKSSTTTTTEEDRVKEGNNNKAGSNGGGESDHEIHIWTERERRKKMRNMFANLHALLPQLPPKADKSTIVDEAVSYIRTLQQTLQKLQKQKLEKLQEAAASSTITTTSNFNICEPSIMSQVQKVAYNDTREAFLADQGYSCNDQMVTTNGPNNPPNLVLPAISHSPVMFQTWTSSNVVLNVCGEQAHISICSPKKPGLFSSICYALEKHKITLVSAQISSDGNRNMYMIHARHASTGASDQFLEAFNPVEEVFKQAVGEIMLWVSS